MAGFVKSVRCGIYFYSGAGYFKQWVFCGGRSSHATLGKLTSAAEGLLFLNLDERLMKEFLAGGWIERIGILSKAIVSSTVD